MIVGSVIGGVIKPPVRGLSPGKGAGGVWTPAKLGSSVLAAWYDVNDPAQVDVVGDGISQIYDKSDNGNHLLQADPTRQALWATPGAQYPPGVDAFMQTAAAFPISGATPRHVFAVIDRQTAGGGTVIFWGNQTNGQAFGVSLNAATNDATAYVWGTGDVSFGADLSNGTRLLYAGNDGTTSYGSQNGALTPASGAATANTASTVLTLGARTTGITSYTQALFREVVIVSGALDAATRQTIEGYLAWNNGAQAKLPAGHPYKNARP